MEQPCNRVSQHLCLDVRINALPYQTDFQKPAGLTDQEWACASSQQQLLQAEQSVWHLAQPVHVSATGWWNDLAPTSVKRSPRGLCLVFGLTRPSTQGLLPQRTSCGALGLLASLCGILSGGLEILMLIWFIPRQHLQGDTRLIN